MAVFWILAPFSLVEVYHRPDDGGSKDPETLVNFHQTTRRYNLEDNHLHAHRRENLKSYLADF
jgi:hypothetical protein